MNPTFSKRTIKQAFIIFKATLLLEIAHALGTLNPGFTFKVLIWFNLPAIHSLQISPNLSDFTLCTVFSLLYTVLHTRFCWQKF